MNRERRFISLMAAFSILFASEGLLIICAAGQIYPQITPQTTPAVSRVQAVQLALNEAETLDLSPFLGGGPIVHQVDPTPINVTFYYSFSIYPKWLITFNTIFYWPMGHRSGAIQVQVAADTGKIDNTSVAIAPTDESTPTSLPSENPTVTLSPTPKPTPTRTSTPTPTEMATPSPTATSQSKENFPDSAAILILVALLVITIASSALAFLLRWKKHSKMLAD